MTIIIVIINYFSYHLLGTPVHQQIGDDFMPIAHGDGLLAGIEGKLTNFVVETKGNQGRLDVTVKGIIV